MAIAYIFAFVVLLLLLVLLFWLPKAADTIRCGIKQLLFRLKHCRKGNENPSIDLSLNVGSWLANHAAVADAITWEQPVGVTGSMIAYPDWSEQMKADLVAACANVVRGQTAGLEPISDADLTLNGNGTVFAVQLTEALAWQYFTAYVAHGLVAEMKNWFPWSLSAYDADALAALFDSRNLFVWGTGPQHYMVLKLHNTLTSHGSTTPSDPGLTFQLVEDLGIIGATRQETLNNIFAWCRDNMTHYYGKDTEVNNMAHWGFKGYPPVEKILQGTDRQKEFGSPEFSHWTAGCWGTTAFMRLVCKTLNIPVTLAKITGHSTPYFVADGLYWSHGDDPYSWFSRNLNPATPPVSPGEYFIDEATLEAWFGSAVPASQAVKNVARRPSEVAAEYLTDFVIQQHCLDIQAGNGHVDGLVYENMKKYYSLADLEAMNLWTRLDLIVAELGGCDNIPIVPYGTLPSDFPSAQPPTP